jgi:D-lactate dehydrogenase (cytochrome)
MVIDQYRQQARCHRLSKIDGRRFGDCEDLHALQNPNWYVQQISALEPSNECPRFTTSCAVPYSGGSSVEGNFSAPYGGICIDFAMMDQILALHKDDLNVVVQPGIGWMELNARISPSGLFFPVDPGPSAMIGGMIGTSCSGTNAVRYGTMKDNVVNLTVVLADGTILKTRGRPRKSAAGYNLTGYFIGSEGTLGIVTEATLKLAVVPPQTSVALVTFPSIRDAASTASAIARAGIQLGAMEIMDEVQMDVVNRAGGTGRKWATELTMFIK